MSPKFDVVISGVSGRFPQCDDVITFRQKLYNQENFITFGDEKWPAHYKYKFGEATIPHGTGKYTNIDKYDAMVFKLNYVFAKSNDIINRKALEPSFEAIMDAGINPYTLDGRNIGVFMSCGINEMDSKGLNAKGDVQDRNLLMMIGSSKTMMSNRISFAYNFKGPSFTYYTDTLGGMEALLAGYKNIADGYVEAAVVGMASSIVDPKISLQFLSLGLLSPDAMCRSFDESANGFGRSESMVLFFLQRAEDAKRNYGTIRLCDSYYLGLNPSTLIGYDENCILDSLKAIYSHSDGRINPSEVSFIEMNACGVQRLEEIESNAVAEIFCKNRKDPLLVGSVKSNVGHAEGASAIMSLLKALFILDTDVIAPNLHYEKANNTNKAIRDCKLKVVKELTKLPGNTVGVNSLGLVGSVGHVVIQQNEKEQSDHAGNESTFPRLLLICGRTEEGLQTAIGRIEALPFNANFVSLANQVFASYMPLHVHRGFTILPKPFKSWCFTGARGDRNRPIWFLFSGMGSQWNCMGRGLLDIPIFANVVRRCNAVLQPRGIDIYKVLTSDDPTIFENIVNSFVGIITIQIGLVEILKALKIEADGIIGHSVGENGCAYADGCLTLEQTVLASWARGVASTEVVTVKGMMAAIGRGYDAIKTSLPQDIEVACHNSTDNCTLTGPADKVHSFVTELQNNGIFAKAVNVANIAYHSNYIAPAGPGLLTRLKEVITEPKARSSKWVSTSVPESAWDTPLAKFCSAEYFTNNLLSAVLFEEGCKHIPDNAIVIEIAPHGLLQAILRKSLPSCSNIPLAVRSKTLENLKTLLSAIGKLYIAGCEPDVNALYPETTYPVPRDTPPISPFAVWDHSAIDVKMKAVERPECSLSGDFIYIQVNEDSQYHYLRHHKIGEKIYIPPAFFMYLTWSMSSLMKNTTVETSSILFENIRVHKNITISLTEPKTVSLMIQESGNFEIFLENGNESQEVTVIMSGKIEQISQNANINFREDTSGDANIIISAGEFYSLLKQAGYVLDDCFVSVKELWKTESDCFGRILWNENWVAFLDSLMKFQMYSSMTTSNLFCPIFIRRLFICGSEFKSIQKGSVFVCHENLLTNSILCNGLEMRGLEYEPMQLSSRCESDSKLKLEGLRFISYTNGGCQSECQFIKLCLHLVSEYLIMAENNNDSKLSVVNELKYLEAPIRRIINEDSTLKSNVCLHKSKEEFCWKSSGCKTCLFLMTDDLSGAITFDLDLLFALTIVPDDTNFETSNAFIEILKRTWNKQTYYFFKKKSTHNDQNKQPNIMQYEDWISKPKMGRPLVIKKHMDATDLSIMLSKQNGFNDTRFLYQLDDSKLTEYENLLKSGIVQVLPTVVLKNGELGTYEKLSSDLDTIHLIEQEKPKDIPPTNIQLKSVEVQYFSFCKENVESSSNNRNRCVEYSGVHKSSHRVMGLTRINTLEPMQTNIDLVWDIPDNWSLEDAASVSFQYAQAYHILFLKPSCKRANSILINVGNEYLLADACIALALQHGFHVFVTISNRADREVIKSKFPVLEESRILFEDNFDTQLLTKTNCKGVDIVVNCIPGKEYVTASLNCVAQFGCVVEVGQHNCSYVNNLGLYQFLKSVSFFAVSHRIATLLNLPEEDKKKLKAYVNDGIKEGTVKPFTKVHSTPNHTEHLKSTDLPKIIKHSDHRGKSPPGMNQKLRCDANHSYIIIGGEHNQSWLKLIKWLTEKGARKFVIAVGSLRFRPTAAHEMSCLVNQKQVNIVMTSFREIDTPGGAAQIINSAERIAPLEAIFFVALECASKKIHNMDVSSRLQCPHVQFICLFSGGLKECESRRANGLPAVVIHGENKRKLTRILPYLHVCLSLQDNRDSPTLYTVVDETDTDETQPKGLSLTDYLPKDVKLLEEIGSSIIACNQFVEVSSSSLRYSETRGVYPVFVIPAVDASQLETLTRKLAYPVFCATCAESSGSVLDIASDLFEALNKIQPKGPVTIIGETWSSNIALEIAALVKQSGRNHRLFLIEGNPLAWQNHLKTLGPVSSQQFDCNLVGLFLDDGECNMHPNSYQEQIKKLVSMHNNVNEENVMKTVNLIRDRFSMMAQYNMRDEILSNVILLQQHQSAVVSSIRLSVTSEVVLLENSTNYKNFIDDSRLSSIINERVLFSWWDYAKV